MVQNGTTRRRIHREQTGLSAAVGGMLLIAATYGMARFGVGLFVPLLAATRPALAGGLGWAAAAQFLSYSVAAIVAARLVDRHPRSGLLLAGATATIGCLGVAVATEPVVLLLAVLTAGLGGGFASPALVPIVDGVLLVVDATRTRRVALAETRKSLELGGARILGTVLNRARPAHRRDKYYAEKEGASRGAETDS